MHTAHRGLSLMSRVTHEAIIDNLRACKTPEEILEFESWFNSKVQDLPLYSIISALLRNRSISRSTASKWFETLLQDRDNKLNSKNI